jgi:SAM-dependent methyltransferase
MEAGTRTGGRQAKLWGARPRDWARLQEGQARPLYEAVLDALGAGSGTEHLDVGCGAGLAAQLAAGRGARVTGIDATPEFLEIARERVPDGEFVQADLEELPFEADRFDTIAGFNSFQFAGDPANALREAARAGKVGTPIAVATWGPREQCETASVLAAYGSLMPPPPPGAEGPFALSEPGRLQMLVEQAGLSPESVADVECVFAYPDLDTALRALNSAGPGTAAIATVGEERVREVVGQALERFKQPDGGYRMRNVFRYLIAVSH